jgi:hypothetical protein
MANVYGMSGGQSVNDYEGEYNITPTTLDITLNTNETILTQDLTIEGDSDLISSAIKYGKSIFGVDGTGVELEVDSNYGTSYRNGQYTGDVITDYTITSNLTSTGQMTLEDNPYNYQIGNDEKLVACWRKINLSQTPYTWDNYYITRYDNSSQKIVEYYVYKNNTVVATLSLADIVKKQFSISTIDNLEYRESYFDGDLFCIFCCNEYVGSLKISYDGSYKTTTYAREDTYTGFPSQVFPPIISEYSSYKYLGFIYRPLGDNTTITIKILSTSGESKRTITINSSTLDNVEFLSAFYGVDGYIYLYSHDIPSSVATNINFMKIATSGSIVYSKTLLQSNFSFEGGSSYLTSSASLIACYVNVSSDVCICYSTSSSGLYDKEGMTYFARFTNNMNTKSVDKRIASIPLTDVSANYWYDVDNSTVLIACARGIVRIDSEGYLYSYYLGQMGTGTDIDDSSYPFFITQDNPPTNHGYGEIFKGNHYYVYTYIDKSITPKFSITTDTYTAELKEV